MKKLLIISSAFFLLSSCKKEIEELPPITQTGANTFGAKVNGALWVPQGFGPIPASNILEARQMGTDIVINARNFASSPNETEFQIYLQNVVATGVYPLNTNVSHPSTDVTYAYYVKRNINPENEWVTSAAYTGSVTISRIDQTNRIVSGTFEFNMINVYNSQQPLSVNEGRFDLRF